MWLNFLESGSSGCRANNPPVNRAPRQRPASFSIDQAIEKLEAATKAK